MTIATSVTLPEYVDTSVVNSTAHRYAVSATNSHGTNADSAPVVETRTRRVSLGGRHHLGRELRRPVGAAVQACSVGSGCGQSIGYTDDGDSLAWNRVHFGVGAESVSVRVASHSSGVTLQLPLNGTSGALVGQVQIGGTGGWDRSTLTAPITGQRRRQPVPRVPRRAARDGCQRLRQPQLDPVRRAGGATGSGRATVPRRLVRDGLTLLRSEGNAVEATRDQAGPAARDRPPCSVPGGHRRTANVRPVVLDSARATTTRAATGWRCRTTPPRGRRWRPGPAPARRSLSRWASRRRATCDSCRPARLGTGGRSTSSMSSPRRTAEPAPHASATSIDDGPSGTTNEGSASFEFSASEPGSTFACSLRCAVAAWTSPDHQLGLGHGEHRFEVRGPTWRATSTTRSPSRTWTI